jgi:hypothetical protein
LIIADEFFDTMLETRFSFSSDGKLSPFLNLCADYNVLATTATYSAAFVDVLKKAYEEVGVVSMVERGEEPADGGDQYKLHVVCDSDYEALAQMAEDKIIELSAEEPVIVFNFPANRLQALKGKLKCYHDAPSTPEELMETCNAVLRLKNGVVFLPFKLRIGVDVRFQQDARVVIISNRPTRFEDIRQMVGRGQRALGKYVGVYYEEKHSGQTEEVKKRVMTPTNWNFASGGLVLKKVREKCANIKDQKKHKGFCQALERQKWSMTKEEFKAKTGSSQ